MRSVKNWQGIPTTRLTLGSEVMVPRDKSTLGFSTELLNYIIASEIPSFKMCNIRYAWIIWGSFGTINNIIINYFCHILFLLGSLLLIRRKKIDCVS